MRIYYFGELIEDTTKPKEETMTAEEPTVAQPPKTSLEHVADLLKEIDLNLDVYRPIHLQKQRQQQLF